ncbi:AraC family transcriptional regulator [Nostoc sp. PA-18-2419]|uniref:AraC family transcriptional regulator n=1 Tax=Nostoc sp. PA-18-2419 TaxID=2575443 RepID=UPI00110937F2|nr:AraC family transcriptional regulator [Nostoc sp. PA-18-2419]
MTITTTTAEWLEWWAEAAKNSLQNPLEPFELYRQVPKQVGKGYERDIEVYPQVLLSMWDCEYHDDISQKEPESNHPLQFYVQLLGNNADNTLISGAGVQRSWMSITPKSRSVGMNIHLPPELLGTFFPIAGGEIPSQFSLLAKDNDLQTILEPKKTSAVNSVVQQIIYCPYQGITKLMFLQVRVLELIRLQLTPLLVDRGGMQLSLRQKPETIACIYHAKDILLSRLENPPSILELAQLVGLSESTLQRGFRQLFGTTVFSYLTDKRMERAEQLLRSGRLSVAEVANLVGYAHLGHFGAAFKRRFGITPSECLFGKKLVSG